MFINRKNKMLLLGAMASAVFSASAFAQATVDQVMAEGEKRADAGAAEQRRVEQIVRMIDNAATSYWRILLDKMRWAAPPTYRDRGS